MIWHSSPVNDVLTELKTDTNNGIWTGDADERIEFYGKNTTSNAKKISLFSLFLSQINNKVIYLLTTVAIISFIVSLIYEPKDCYFSLLIIALAFLNSFFSALHLFKCNESLDEIQNASKPKVQVLRDGKIQFLVSELLVPGDIIFLKEGDYITADARLIESNALRCNEIVLTGDLIPVEKDANTILEDITPISARKNMIYSGCNVVHGNATAVVVETGLRTEIGKITDLNRQTNSETLPITESLKNSGKTVNLIIFIICVITFFVGIIQNINSDVPFASVTVKSLLNSVALGICALPESLPAISTIVIALGIHRMTKDNIVIKNTRALELLGKTEVFCVDKTGILTKNNMKLAGIYNGNEFVELNGEALSDKTTTVLQLAVSCSMLKNDATEIAIENAALDYLSLSKVDAENLFPKLSYIPFDSARKTMTSINMINGTPVAIVKGAPEMLLDLCDIKNKDELLKLYNSLTQESYRVIALAIKKLNEIPSNPSSELIENNLKFVGLLALYDPPQSDTVDAINTCNIAGIKTIMTTGDNIDTAKSIARRIGILTDDSQAISGLDLANISDEELVQTINNYTVFARITPQDKLRIIKAWQQNGKIVAVTGTDTDDADALSVADIGCSVGIYGSDVAKGNADVIIENKKFVSLINAIRESRGLFENVKKSVSYLLSCNFGEIIAFVIGMLIFKLPPLTAIQLVLINLLTDSTTVISLTLEKSEKSVMKQKPLALSGHLFSSGAVINIVCDALIISVLTIVSSLIGGGTMAFSTLALTQIFHSFNHKTHDSLIKADFKSNKFMNISSLITLSFVILLVTTPVGILFGISRLTFNKFLLSILLSILIVPLCEIKKLASREIAKKVF